MRDRSSIAFVTAEEASLDAFLSVSAAIAVPASCRVTCALRKLAWPPGYAIQSLEKQGLASASADETAPEVPGAFGGGPGGPEGSICPRQTRPVRFGYDREQRQHEHR